MKREWPHAKWAKGEKGLDTVCPRGSSRPLRESRSVFADSSARAFSLVELLVVIAILLILMAMVLPATTSLMRSMNISRAASLVTDEMNFARQTALSRNRDVELRFYRLGSKLDGGAKQFRAMRSFLADGTDATKSQPLSKVKHLPDSVILSDNTTLSSLLDYQNPARSGLTQGTEALPSGSTEYVSFLFRANGGTSLKPIAPPEGNWFVTVTAENVQADGGNELPANYFTAQVDPVTGRTRSYRP